MKKSLMIPLLVSVLLLVLCLVFNPTAEQHRAKIKADVSNNNPLAGALGLGALQAFASSYHSLGVVSYTKMGDQTQTFGLLGMVFVRDVSAE